MYSSCDKCLILAGPVLTSLNYTDCTLNEVRAENCMFSINVNGLYSSLMHATTWEEFLDTFFTLSKCFEVANHEKFSLVDCEIDFSP